MRFHDELSVNLFLLEVGSEMIESASSEFVPSEEQLEFFFKKRSKLVHKLIDFKKSQQLKMAWKKNRWKYMKGITKFHKSTDGKRFHRQLGNFLARNDFSKGFLRSSHESLVNGDLGSVLKAISSARTHAYIETEFYCSLEEHADYIIFLEEFMAVTHELEKKLYELQELDEDDVESMLNVLGSKNILFELCKKYNVPEDSFSVVEDYWNRNMNESNEYSLLACYLKTERQLVNIS